MNRPAWPRRWTRILLVIMTAAVVPVAGAASANAHDVLVSTSPANGAVVPAVPPAVTLRFDQTALAIGTEVEVTGPGGAVQTGKASVVDATVTQRVQPGAPAGRYTVNWRVTSVDGHPVSGTFTFTATGPGQGTARKVAASANQAVTSTAGSALPWALVAASAVLLALVFGAVLWSRRLT
jgi:methionine-rich copper-binding protein CopC